MMGIYAAMEKGLFDPESGIAGKARGRLERTLLVADFEPSPALMEQFLGGTPRFFALPSAPQLPLAGAHYGTFRTATNPLQFDASLLESLNGKIDTVAFLLPPSSIHGKTLLWLRSRGVRRVLYLRRGRIRHRMPRAMALSRWLVRRLPAAWRGEIALGEQIVDEQMTETDCRQQLAAFPRRELRPAPTGRPWRIAHFVCSLNSGGAERQACYAAVGQKQLGHDVRVFCRQSLVGVDGHYLPLLEPHNIEARRIGGSASPPRTSDVQLQPGQLRLLPSDLRETVADLAGELIAWRPDVLHCYVDDCAVPGFIAASLAQTPAVVLSFRNGNPSHFPGLLRPWMKPWYRTMLHEPGVRFCANAEGGARDYEHWLGLAAGTIPVIRNAFYPSPVPRHDEAMAWRQKLQISCEAPLVAGVFRLQAEKRPLLFLDCVQRLRQALPSVQVVLAGVGDLESAVHSYVKQLGLQETVHLLGQRNDIPTLLAASDVLLLVSYFEGTPNVVLEAQSCGCVPIVTRAGGSAEALDPGRSGIVVDLDDAAGAVEAAIQLLQEPSRRRAMAARGRAFVQQRYAPQKMHDANMRLYAELFSDPQGFAKSA